MNTSDEKPKKNSQNKILIEKEQKKLKKKEKIKSIQKQNQRNKVYE